MLSARLPLRHEGGFTLVELLVSMSILVIGVTVAWSALMTTTVKTAGRAQELATLQTEVRSTVDRLAADLRQAACNDTVPPVTTATGTQLTFYSPDRASPYHLRQVAYQLSGGELDRAFATSTNTNGPPWTIPALGSWAKQVGSIVNSTVFTYEDANGNPTSNPASVASVNVALTVAARPGLGGASSTYQTSIALRTPTCA